MAFTYTVVGISRKKQIENAFKLIYSCVGAKTDEVPGALIVFLFICTVFTKENLKVERKFRAPFSNALFSSEYILFT